MTDDPFRNDHDAALARADALERENAKLRDELRDAHAPKPKRDPKPKPKPDPKPNRRNLSWIRPLGSAAAVVAVGFAVVEIGECRAHALLYTNPGRPRAGFIAGDEVVIVDDVEAKVGYRDFGSEDSATRVTVLDAATGKQLAVHLLPWNTICQPIGVSMWCGETNKQGARYDLPSFDPVEWPAPTPPEEDRTCKTEAMLEAHCEHAEHVGNLLVVLSLQPDKRAYAIDQASYHTVWTFGRH